MKTKRLSRRDFLKCLAHVSASRVLYGEALAALLQTVAEGKWAAAHAATGQNQGFKWVDFRFNDAPARWVYDLFLHTSDAETAALFKTSGNRSLVNRYRLNAAGYYDGGMFSTVKLGNSSLRVPYIWQFNVPAVGGGTRPMADLLQNFLNIRGIYSGTSGHGTNRALHYLPNGSLKSLHALTADESQAPIAAINADPGLGFRSTNNKTAVALNLAATTPLPPVSLLAPFRASASVAGIRANEASVLTQMAQARNALTQEALARSGPAVGISSAMSGARELIFSNFANVEAEWGLLVAKYEGLIDRSLKSVVPGINDRPIGRPVAGRTPSATVGDPNFDDLSYQYGADTNGVGRILQCADLRTILQPNTKILQLAQGFALAEFVLRHGLSDSITANIRQMYPIIDHGVSPPFTLGHGYDEHTIGSMAGVLLSTLQAVAHASCMLELSDRLKEAGIWNRTLINSSGEMNRTPLKNGSGSDHSSTVNLALHSGAIAGPMVLGNIASESAPNGVYPGTWGAAAPQAELSSGRIEPSHAINTIATILGVSPPVPGRPSLVTMNGGIVVPTVATGKIIA